MSQEKDMPDTMNIVAACVPPLVAGTYQVDVEQQVETPESTEVFDKTARFTVEAPRYRLPLEDVYSSYPADAAVGSFDKTLPHVVLSRRTLPWERSIDHSGNDPDPPRPWMALLILDEDELASLRKPLIHRTVAEVTNSEDGVRIPKLIPSELDNDSEVCTTLDISTDLFQRLAPTWQDLPWLAHARQISCGDMDETGMLDPGADSESWFSVVVANRLPTQGKQHLACLVSLEGHKAEISGHPDEQTGTAEHIRLLVLTSWRFQDDTQGKGFYQLASRLSHAPLRLAAEVDEPVTARLLESGYVPLQHQTLVEKTMSWYRGPLVPVFLPTAPQNRIYRSADAALLYDPATGLYDVSYATAWQIGRLLGLQDQSFTQTLSHFRNAQARQAAEALHGRRLAKLDVAELLRAYLHGEAGSAWRELADQEEPGYDRALSEALSSTVDTPPVSISTTDPKSGPASSQKSDMVARFLPEALKETLGRLFLLHGVPASYLLPHPDLLGEEDLRYFHIDPDWVGALIDGALSIGRLPESELALDKAMASHYLEILLDGDIVIEGDEAEARSSEIGHLTGFLLRSPLVSGWRGLRLTGLGPAGKPLKALRIERLGPDILLCIYAGPVRTLVIRQPEHEMHFGFKRNENGQLIKSMDGEDKLVEVKLRPEQPSVIQIQALAKSLKADHSAEFAWQLLDRPAELRVEINYRAMRPAADGNRNGGT